jgi:hypothetical protein
VQLLRGPAEATVATLADAINEAPDVRSVLAGRERYGEILRDFLEEVLRQGLERRIDALARRPGDGAAAHGLSEWVDKYRRMQAAEGRLAPPSPAVGESGRG